ncbi:hypothetical protein LJC11_04085 [Bacteroidales bacterium OttesenSCG-928-I21]|nr:hypothetical protein [Bacteroidales bacterium OttesenSCG-928-I21]
MISFCNYNITATFTGNLTSNFISESSRSKFLNMNGGMYDPVISRVLSPDNYVQNPDNAQNYNRYSYCLNNPLKYWDPTGMLVDKYFDELGNYLGDDKVGYNIRIISQSQWNMYTDGFEDLSTIEAILKQAGILFSDYVQQTNMNEEYQLNVYQHFNPTYLELKNFDYKGNGNMGFAYGTKGIMKPFIRIDLFENLSKNKYADNYLNITNMFQHEDKHYLDYKLMGYEIYKNFDSFRKERRAIELQMNHSSWTNTSDAFKKGILEYLDKNTYKKIQTLQINIIH